MTAQHTPVRAIALKLAATASLAVALGGAVLAGQSAARPALAAPAASHAVTAAMTPYGRCGSDCPWDGEYL